MRDYDEEIGDNSSRKYHYDFDSYVRGKLIERWKPFFSGAEALEIGPYSGEMTSMLSTEFERLCLVEASGKMVDVLRRRFPETEVVNSEIESWKGAHKFTDVFLVHTLEHMPNPVMSLGSIRERLSEGGRLFVAVPNAQALSRQIAVSMGLIDSIYSVTEGERLQGHFRTYDLKSLLKDISSAGLRVISSGGVVTKPLANFQIDLGIQNGVISREYLEACDNLSKNDPTFSSSVYVVATQ